MRTNLTFGGTAASMLMLLASVSFAQSPDTTQARAIITPGNNSSEPGKINPPRIPAYDFHNIFSPLKDKLGPATRINPFSLPLDLKGPVLRMNKTTLSASVNSSAISGETMETTNFQNANVSSGISLWNVPFAVGYNSTAGWQQDMNHLSMGMAKFDKDKFLDQLRERIRKIADPADFFRAALSEIYAKRDQAVATIRKELSAAIQMVKGNIPPGIAAKINTDNISHQGFDQFLHSLMTGQSAELEEKKQALISLQQNATGAAGQDSMTALTGEIDLLSKQYEQLQTQTASLRNKWFANGILKTIYEFEKDKQEATKKLMDDPATVSKLAADKLKLPGIQKILVHARSINFGATGISQGRLGLQDAFIKGISMEFLKGQRYLAPVLGTLPGIKNMTDMLYTNARELPDIFTTALKMGKGDPQKNFSHVSLALYQPQSNQQFLPGSFQNVLPKNLVTTFSKKISLGASHSLLTEISKSTMLYNNGPGGVDGGVGKMVNTDNLLGNMGVNVNYTGDFKKLGLTQNLAVRYTGKEYSNLGNFSLVSGSKELVNDLRKYFLKNKLILQVRAHFREYSFSTDQRKWQSFSYLADLKWKLKKGEFAEIRYQPYYNRRIGSNGNHMNSRSERIAVRGNLNRKVGKGFTYRNFIELAGSKDNFYDFVLDKFIANKLISFTTLQTLVIGNKSLFVNFTGNHASQNTGYLFGNSSLSADAGISFAACKKISLSSSLVYTEVNRMYGQVAVRQSVSTVLGKHISIEGFVHVGKNLYEHTGLRIPALSGDLSISYNLK